MKRDIVHIDAALCTGCGICASHCHEGAIEMRNGKAVLVSDEICDGLGACLPSCPAGAITIEEREAAPFDEEAVRARAAKSAPFVCPGSAAKSFSRANDDHHEDDLRPSAGVISRLAQWPVQIKLVSPNAPFFDGADLFVAADCCAYARADLHERFMKGRITLIGCPKLDGVDYTEKLTAIIASGKIRSVALARMEVPCCGGLEAAVKNAIKSAMEAGMMIPWQVSVISTDGELLR